MNQEAESTPVASARKEDGDPNAGPKHLARMTLSTEITHPKPMRVGFVITDPSVIIIIGFCVCCVRRTISIRGGVR